MRSSFPVEVQVFSPSAGREVEIVERKGLGHPDTICDSIAEEVSRTLCTHYLSRVGHVLHHNADKALLVAGRSEPAFGGGRVREPMRLIVGDRATIEWRGEFFPVHELAEEAARRWISANLRFVDPREHLTFESALHPGSGQLTDVFARGSIGAPWEASAR